MQKQTAVTRGTYGEITQCFGSLDAYKNAKALLSAAVMATPAVTVLAENIVQMECANDSPNDDDPLTPIRNRILNEDCLIGMARIPDQSISMVLCDLPYGTTQCPWDTVIPMDELWAHYKRIIKPRGAIVLTAAQPFTSALVMSNPKMFRYSWIWEKNKATGHLSAKSQPMRKHEDVLVFAKQAPGYNPQGTVVGSFNSMRPAKGQRKGEVYGQQRNDYGHSSVGNYPKSIIPFPVPAKPIHPTQKPVELFEYLIKTYTNPGDVVLDNCMGSGTTAVACINTGRDYVGFETDERYHQSAMNRIAGFVFRGT